MVVETVLVKQMAPVKNRKHFFPFFCFPFVPILFIKICIRGCFQAKYFIQADVFVFSCRHCFCLSEIPQSKKELWIRTGTDGCSIKYFLYSKETWCARHQLPFMWIEFHNSLNFLPCCGLLVPSEFLDVQCERCQSYSRRSNKLLTCGSSELIVISFGVVPFMSRSFNVATGSLRFWSYAIINRLLLSINRRIQLITGNRNRQTRNEKF